MSALGGFNPALALILFGGIFLLIWGVLRCEDDHRRNIEPRVREPLDDTQIAAHPADYAGHEWTYTAEQPTPEQLARIRSAVEAQKEGQS